MLVYEYLPYELARLDVLGQATGLDLNQVMERVRLAAIRETLVSAGPDEPHALSEVWIASFQHSQWRRIACVMAEQRMSVYKPSEDRRAVRYDDERLQRLEKDCADAGQPDGQGPIERLRHRVYRITARPAAALAGEQPLVRHYFAGSEAAAVGHAQRSFSRQSGTNENGEYRIVSVEQILPRPGEFF
ncbi:hypothetical protein ACIRTB_11990 [Streptomyces sp. NPDC101158]|uniref:hypothetical protein n=1 Tax=Streptomyces sp. NPDC101158 TaxID=3366117 RepID=UPI0038146FF6